MEIITNTVPISSGVSLTDNIDAVWNSLDLTAGTWLVGGQTGVYGSGTTFTHMHADHGDGTTTIQTSPGCGTTTALHLTSNHSNGWIFPLGVRPYVLTEPTTINGVLQCNFSGGPAIAYGNLWALRIA